MCHKIIFEHNKKDIEVEFFEDNAQLPFVSREGETKFGSWGRRKHQSGNLPLGGFALLDDIYSRQWKEFSPKSVKLPIKSFMVNNIETKNHWYHLSRNRWIQGLLATYDNEHRLYIVTLTLDDEGFVFLPRVLQ